MEMGETEPCSPPGARKPRLGAPPPRPPCRPGHCRAVVVLVFSSPSPAATLPPPAVFKAACSMSAAKAVYSFDKTLVLGFLAGALIGIGGLLQRGLRLLSWPRPGQPGARQLRQGRDRPARWSSVVILTGGELFTGNVFIMISGLLSGRVTATDLSKNWFWSFWETSPAASSSPAWPSWRPPPPPTLTFAVSKPAV